MIARTITNRLLGAVGTLSLMMCTYGCHKSDQQGTRGDVPPRSYPIRVLTEETAEVQSSYPASLKGKLDVDIRPQVSGQIVRLAVDEGARVQKGQTLFVIDQVQYQEAVNAASAALKVAEAAVDMAELTARNNRELAKGKVIGDYALKTSESNLLSAQARLAQAKAQLISAEKNLSFTYVTSPTSGVVGSIPFRVGSLVSPSSTRPLTTVSDISEVYAYFSLTERQLLEMCRTTAGSAGDLPAHMPTVKLLLVDDSEYPYEGRIETMSGVIDAVTGSIGVRALFPNPDGVLRSGSTGRVIIPTVMQGVIKVPQKATYQIQNKTFVYVVDDQNVVHAREIQLYSQNDGMNYLVTNGLTAGEKIVTEGVITLRDEAKIEPQAE